MSTLFKLRQIDKYDGQCIFQGGKIVFELGNYLGGGASGSVYQAFDPAWQSADKGVAIKILNPLGYKNLVFGNINQCQIAVKGCPLSQDQITGKTVMNAQNVWWLVHYQTNQLFAAFEDPQRMSLRELPLTRCVEIWGLNPLGIENISESEAEKINFSSNIVHVDGKEYKIPMVSPKFLKFLKSRQVVCREMSNMAQIGEHPNIVDLLEVLELIQDSKTTLFLVLELVNGGELFDRMKSGMYSNLEEFAKRYFSQLLSGIEYCHKRGIVHRDLKPENLLLSDPTESAILKIADFGLSAVIFAAESSEAETVDFQQSTVFTHFPKSKDPKENNKSVYSNKFSNSSLRNNMMSQNCSPRTPDHGLPASMRRLRSLVGSPHYIAPEIASGDPLGYDGRKVDMWSAGVILYSLFTGSLPFAADLSNCPRFKRYKHWLVTEYSASIRDGKEIIVPSWFWPIHVSSCAGSLLVGLLHHDPNLRLSASEAVRHPWVKMENSVMTTLSPQQLTYEPTSLSPNSVSLENLGNILSHRIQISPSPNSCHISRLASYNNGLESRFNNSSNSNNNSIANSNFSPTSLNETQAEPQLDEPGRRNVNRRLIYNYSAILEQQRQKESEATSINGRNQVDSQNQSLFESKNC